MSGIYDYFYDELMKIAGEVDKDALKKLMPSLRGGDIVSFKQHAADKTNLKDLAMTTGLSKTISEVTGSPYSHTAMIDSIEPPSAGFPDGRVKLIHNFEQGKSKAVAHQYLDELADSTSFNFKRPRVAKHVSDKAVESARKQVGKAAYSKADLLTMAPQEAARNYLGKDSKATKAVRKATGLVSKAKNMQLKCDPNTGVCSFLPVSSYGEALGGKAKALKHLVGEGFDHTGNTSVSPAMLAQSLHMDEIGDYSPKNLNKSVRKQAVTLAKNEAADFIKEKGRRVIRKLRKLKR